MLIYEFKVYIMTEVGNTSNLKHLAMNKEMSRSLNKLKEYDTYRLKGKKSSLNNLDLGHKADSDISSNSHVQYGSSPFFNKLMNADTSGYNLHNTAVIGKQPASYRIIAKSSEALLKSEQINEEGNPTIKTISTHNAASETGSSLHRNSLTFKSIGPEIDSTVDSNGVKYSQMFSIDALEESHNIGYYGKTRLTR